MPQFFAFGNSITYGQWDSEGGWVERLRKYLDEKGTDNPDFFDAVYNLGIAGDTSSDVLKRFREEMLERIDRGEKVIIFFDVGINDSGFLVEEKKHVVLMSEFAANIKEIVKICQEEKFDAEIFFLGIGPVDEEVLSAAPWHEFHVHRNKYIGEYNRVLEAFCAKNKYTFIDIFNLFLGQPNFKKLFFDGLHPNSEGHKLIFEAIRDCLAKKDLI